MSILLRTLMARMATRIIYEGVITAGDLHIATKDGEAMFFHDSIDFSTYAGTDAGSTPYRLEFTDSAGKKASAYGGAAGGGEALGDEALTGWTNAPGTYDGFDTFTTTGSTIDSVVNSSGVLQRAITNEIDSTVGSLFKYVLPWTLNSGSSVTFRAGASSSGATSLSYGYDQILSASGTSTFYNNQQYPYGVLFSTKVVDGELASPSAKKLTDVPATGLHLMSAKNGTTRNMTSVETGFNPNAITGVKIYG